MRLMFAAMLTAILAAPLPLAAQQQEDAAAAAESDIEVTRNADWEVACRDVERDGETARACEMRQILVNQETQQEWVRITVGFAPNSEQPVLQIFTPLGVLLQPGMEIQVDNGETERVQYAVCLARPPRCLIAGPMNEAMVNLLKRGIKGTLTFTLPNNRKVNAPFSLAGFTKSFNSLPR